MANDSMGPLIQGELNLVGRWTDAGLLSGVNATQLGYGQLIKQGQDWARASTLSSTTAASGINKVQTALSMATNAWSKYNTTVSATGTARPFAQQIAGLAGLVLYTRQLGTSLRELDLLQASYARIAGASSSMASATTMSSQAMDDAITIAAAYGASIKDVMSTMVELARLGNSPSQVLYLTEALGELRLLLASGTGELLSMSKAMGTVVTMMNQFETNIYDAVDGMKLMAEYDIRTATSFDKIQIAMNRFAGAARIANMTLTETIQVATAATETGIGGSRAGTMLNSVLSRIGSNQDAIKMLKELGVSTVVVKDGMLTAASSMDQLLEAYRKLIANGASTKQMTAFAQAFAGLRLQSPMLAMLGVLDRRTKLQVDAAGFQKYTDQLQQDLQRAAVQSDLAIPIGITPMFDQATVRQRVQEGTQELIESLQRSFESTQNIAVRSLSDYVSRWFQISPTEAKALISQYKSLFGELQTIIGAYSVDVESPYAIMARNARAETKELQDERNRAVDLMANTVEATQSRLKTAWESTFISAGATKVYKAGLEELTNTVIALGDTIMNAVNWGAWTLGLGDVELGVRNVIRLFDVWLSFKTGAMVGNLFSGAIQSLGVMTTRLNLFGRALTTGPIRDYARSTADFFNNIDASLVRVGATMRDLSSATSRLSGLGGVSSTPVSLPTNSAAFSQQIRSTLSGAGLSPSALTNMMNATTKAMITLGPGIKTVEQLDASLTSLTTTFHALGPEGEKAASALAKSFAGLTNLVGGQRGAGVVLNELQSYVPKLDKIMADAQRVLTSPFSTDAMKQSAREMQTLARSGVADLIRASNEITRIRDESMKANGVITSGAQAQIDAIRRLAQQSVNEIEMTANRAQTVWGRVAGTLGTAFSALSKGTAIAATLYVAFTMLWKVIKASSDWLSEIVNQVREMKHEFEIGEMLDADVKRGLDSITKYQENATQAATLIHKQITEILASPYKVDALVNAIASGIGVGDTAMIRRTLSSVIRNYTDYALQAIKENKEVEPLAKRIVDALDAQFALNFSTDQQNTLATTVNNALTQQGLDMVELAKTFTQLTSTLKEVQDEIERVQSQIVTMTGTRESLSKSVDALLTSALDSLFVGTPYEALSAMEKLGDEVRAARADQATLEAELATERAKGANIDTNRITTLSEQLMDAIVRASQAGVAWREQAWRLPDVLRDRLLQEGPSSADLTAIRTELLTNVDNIAKDRVAELRALFDDSTDKGEGALSVAFTQVMRLLGENVTIRTASMSQILKFFTSGEELLSQDTAVASTYIMALRLFMTRLSETNIPTIGLNFMNELNDERRKMIIDTLAEMETLIAALKENENNLEEKKKIEVQIQDAEKRLEELFTGSAAITDIEIQGVGAAIDQIDAAIKEGKEGSTAVAELKKQRAELVKRWKELHQQQIAALEEQKSAIVGEEFAKYLVAQLDPAIRDSEAVKAVIDDLVRMMTTLGTEWHTSIQQFNTAMMDFSASSARGDEEAKAKAQKKMDDAIAQIFTTADRLIAEASEKGQEALDATITMIKAAIPDIPDDVWDKIIGDPTQRGDVNIGAVPSTFNPNTAIPDPVTQVAIEKNTARIAELETKIIMLEKALASKNAVPSADTGTDPVRDLVANLKNEHQERMAGLETAYRVLEDANGQIVEYLDRTNSLQYIEDRITLNTQLLDEYLKALKDAQDPKLSARLKKEIAQIQRDIAKAKFEITLKFKEDRVDWEEHTIGLMERTASALEDMDDFAGARAKYTEIYERQLALLEEQRIEAIKSGDIAEQRTAAMEKQTLQLDHQRKLAELVADEFVRASEAGRPLFSGYLNEFKMFDTEWGGGGFTSQYLQVQQGVKQINAEYDRKVAELKASLAEGTADLTPEAIMKSAADDMLGAGDKTDTAADKMLIAADKMLIAAGEEGVVTSIGTTDISDPTVPAAAGVIFAKSFQDALGNTNTTAKQFEANGWGADSKLIAEMEEFERQLKSGELLDMSTATASLLSDIGDWLFLGDPRDRANKVTGLKPRRASGLGEQSEEASKEIAKAPKEESKIMKIIGEIEKDSADFDAGLDRLKQTNAELEETNKELGQVSNGYKGLIEEADKLKEDQAVVIDNVANLKKEVEDQGKEDGGQIAVAYAGGVYAGGQQAGARVSAFDEGYELGKKTQDDLESGLDEALRVQSWTGAKDSGKEAGETMAAEAQAKLKEGIDKLRGERKQAIEELYASLDYEEIKPGAKVPWTNSDGELEMLAPTRRNIERLIEMRNQLVSAQDIGKKTVEELDAITEQVTALDSTIEALIKSLSLLYQATHEAMVSGWDEGFNIGLEKGFTAEGVKELKVSIKKNIASQVSKYIQDMIAKKMSVVISDMFTEMFQGLPDILGSSISGLVAPVFGGIVGSIIGFLIGGMFSDFVEEQAEAQLKQQKDSVNAQGFGWSYQEADKAEPYYQFAPDVTKESVNIINFRTTFNISTDAAQAMMAQRRELERVCTEIFNNMARAASASFGPRSAA